MPRFCFVIPDLGGKKIRLDQALKEAFAKEGEATPSRESIKKAIAANMCLVNGLVCTNAAYKLKGREEITFTLENEDSCVHAEEGALDIVWEDEDIVLCNKPADLTVHPCPSCPKNTLLQRLLTRYPELAAMGGERPGIVHRIDKDTSGLILVARNEPMRLALSEAFASRSIHKQYLALVAGEAPEYARIEEPIGRDPQHKVRMCCLPLARGGKPALSEAFRLWVASDKSCSLVRVHIHTGRTHQIRVHMAFLGHPLLGDSLYAPKHVAEQAPRQMLHAWHIAFTHPVTHKRLAFTCPLAPDFFAVLTRAHSHCQCLVVTGNPGSGKSTVTKFFQQHNIATISADELVKSYYAKKGALRDLLVQRLGDEVLAQDGSIDKTALMPLLQASPELRRDIEQWTHRLVHGDIQAFFTNACQAQQRMCVAEIPLYFECEWHKHAFQPQPLSIGVGSNLTIRTQRLSHTRQWSEEKIAAIESWQWPEDKKLAACDYVLNNSGSYAALEQSVQTQLLPALAQQQEHEQAQFVQHIQLLLQQEAAKVSKEDES